MDFFTRIDFMTLEPGNKTAGFLFNVAVPAIEALNTVQVSEAEWAQLVADSQLRLRRAGVLSDELVAESGLGQFKGTAVPRSFWVGRTFAAGLGAEPSELEEAATPESAPYLGPELAYSPHNVDAPAQALGLMILVQTWSEWAWAKLALAAASKAKTAGQDSHL